MSRKPAAAGAAAKALADEPTITSEAGDQRSSGSPEPGQILRALRTRHGWTLADVSTRTGLPVPTLSKLENGRASFSYDKLMQVSRGLDIDITQLLAPIEPRQPDISRITGRRSIARAGEGAPVKSGTYDYRHLAADLLNKQFVPMVGEIRARSLEEFGRMIQHPGEEFVYVLEGRLELHTSIYAPAILEAGDSIFFDSDMAHAYVAAGPGPCRVLSICSNPRG